MGRGYPEFKPELTPGDLLELGVFGGKYMTDCVDEFPAEWFEHARLNPDHHDPDLNFFGINASKPLSYWQRATLAKNRRMGSSRRKLSRTSS